MAKIFTIENVIVLLSFIGGFLSVMAVLLPFFAKDQLASRMKSVAARREELQKQQKAKFQQKTRFQPKSHVSLMKVLLERMKLENMLDSREIRVKLFQAGYRNKQAAVIFTFTRVALPTIFAIFLLFLMLFTDRIDQSFPMKMLILGGAVAVGWYLPAIVVKNTTQNRQKMLQRAFPDALDLLTICVESGLSVEAAFGKVSEEMSESAPELAEEMGLTTAELSFLGDRRAAFDNFSERTGLPAVRSLVTALIQSEKYGTPVSVSLRVISQENREARMSAAEKKAGALPAQLTVPMIMFFLPVLFIVVIGPAIIQAVRQFSH